MIESIYSALPPLLFLSLSFGEIFIVVAAIFIIFGPQRIPEFARKFGKGMREVKKATSDIKREINKEVNQIKTDVDLDRIASESELNSKPKKEEEAKPNNKDTNDGVKL